MTNEDVISMAREAGLDIMPGHITNPWVMRNIKCFAAIVAAAERIKHQADIRRLTTLANTAEKWRGIAMARDGDGRTVQEVQAEAVAAEREACAKVCERIISGDGICADDGVWIHDAAAAIRARGNN